MDSADWLPLDLDRIQGFQQCIGHEPEQMPSGFAQDDPVHCLLLAEIFDQVVAVCFEAADPWRVVSADKKDLGLQGLVPFASLETHLAYLLRDQAHHEDDDGGGEKQRAHVRKAAPDRIGV